MTKNIVSKPVENMAELTEKLAQYVHDLETDAIQVKKASELFNGMGKIVNAQKVLLEYASLRREKPNIPFLEISKSASAFLDEKP